jgi:uncharacterized membrane protein
MRKFSFRPALTLRGRKFKGLRGWSGKPLHPPFTAVPIGAYVLVAVFDVISFVGQDQEWARDFYRAATFTLVGGAAVSIFTALTGFWDWLRSTEAGTQARRTASAHAVTMLTVTVLVLVGIGVRLFAFDGDAHTPGLALALSIAAAALTGIGGTIGGSLVYDYGFNVETAGDHPVWHRSERDVHPGDDKRELSLSEAEQVVEKLTNHL